MPLRPDEPCCLVVIASLQLEQVLSLMPETNVDMSIIKYHEFSMC